MALGAVPQTKRRNTAAGPTSQAQRQIEQVRSTIPGEGVYLVASIETYPHRSFPAPSPDLKDLALTPGLGVAIADDWLLSIPLVQAFNAGDVQLAFTNSLPTAGQPNLDPELIRGLDPRQVRFVIEVTNLPLSKQIIEVISLANLMPKNGIPRPDTSRVTKTYLKTIQLPMLYALADLESRKKNRPEVVELARAQIAKIEAL